MTNLEEKNIVLFGGIYENNKEIVERMMNNLGDQYKISITTKKTVYGAVKKAFKLSNTILDKTFEEQFMSSYNEVIK